MCREIQALFTLKQCKLSSAVQFILWVGVRKAIGSSLNDSNGLFWFPVRLVINHWCCDTKPYIKVILCSNLGQYTETIPLVPFNRKRKTSAAVFEHMSHSYFTQVWSGEFFFNLLCVCVLVLPAMRPVRNPDNYCFQCNDHYMLARILNSFRKAPLSDFCLESPANVNNGSNSCCLPNDDIC